MGYSTDFHGSFEMTPPLKQEHIDLLDKFAEERHEEGEDDLPGYYCQWIPDLSLNGTPGSLIVWDGHEKFYNAAEWMAYLIKHFLDPWGYEVEGTVQAVGEEFDDWWLLHIRDNKVFIENQELVATGVKQEVKV